MAWAYQDEGSLEDNTDGNIEVTVDVAEGDLIVVAGTARTDTHGCDTITDEDANSYTLQTLVDASNTSSVRTGYAIAQSTNATLTITITFTGAGSGNRGGIVGVFRPDAGDEVTLEDQGQKASGWEASPWETGTFSTTGSDELVVAFFQAHTTRTFTNHEIPSGTAATGVFAAGGTNEGFYRILTSTFSNGLAEVDSSGTGYYACQALAFTSVAGAPAGIVLFRRRRM